jgi:hypothetical protein
MTEEKSQLDISRGANEILKKQIANYRNLAERLIEQNVKTAAKRAGKVRPQAMQDILRRGRQTFQVLEDGSAIEPRDKKGVMIFGNSAVNPISMNEWAEGLRKEAPHLWEPDGDPRHAGGNIGNLEGQLAVAIERRDLQAQIRLKRLIAGAKINGVD